MSACFFIASNYVLSTHKPELEYPVYIDVDRKIVDDGGSDDNYFLNKFNDVDKYSYKKYGVYLEWNYTDERAKKIIEYIKKNLENTDTIEFWHIYLIDYYEFEDRPIINKKVVSINDLSIFHIKEVINSKIWNEDDRMYPNRPTFYCLEINK